MTISTALQLEQENRIVEAAAEYEALLMKGGASAEMFVNTLVLYWQATDYGFSSGLNLPANFVQFAAERLSTMLASRDGRVALSPEFSFWRRYIAWADLGEELDSAECERLMELKPGYLEPAMFVFASSGGREQTSAVDELLSEIEDCGTTRCRYVRSVILGVKKRRDAPGAKVSREST